MRCLSRGLLRIEGARPYPLRTHVLQQVCVLRWHAAFVTDRTWAHLLAASPSRCLLSLPKAACPLCRSRFDHDDVRRVHVDKTQLPPSTPSLSFADIDAARRLQTQSTRLVLHGGSTDEYRELIGELGSWLETQYAQEVCYVIRYFHYQVLPRSVQHSSGLVAWRSARHVHPPVEVRRDTEEAGVSQTSCRRNRDGVLRQDHGCRADLLRPHCGRRANLLRPTEAD